MSNGDVTKWVNVEYLEKLARLCRGTDSRQFEGSINHVNEANIILMFSNAPFHELEQMLILQSRFRLEAGSSERKNRGLGIKIS